MPRTASRITFENLQRGQTIRLKRELWGMEPGKPFNILRKEDSDEVFDKFLTLQSGRDRPIRFSWKIVEEYFETT